MTSIASRPLTNAITVCNPATGAPFGGTAACSAREVEDAVARARAAQPRWAATPLSHRLQILSEFQKLLCEQREQVAGTITREAGKPLAEALSTEILVVLDCVNYLAEYLPAFLRPEHVAHSNLIMKLKRGTLRRTPYGVVGIISPWNYPFSLPTNQAITALMTGNAVVLKPSELTPFSSLEAQRLMLAAGLDPDLFQVVTGDGAAGAALLQSGIHKMVFTGSVATGKRVAQAAASRLLPVVLELGGKDPMIVLEDADLEVVSSAAVWGAFMNAGQTCLSVERCYVHESLYDRFLQLCAEKAIKLRVGDGAHPDTDIGPMIHQRQLQTVREHVEDALAKGARLLCGGAALPQLGPSFYAPTVLAEVNHSMRIMREETFGPVLPVQSFKTEDEAIALANDSEFGLSASVWTSDTRRGETLAGRIEAGTVMVNDMIACFGISEAPHGGVKASGIGRTHGSFGLEEMVWPKYVDSDRLPKMKKLWWYGYGPEFFQQMNGFIEFLFHKKLKNRLQGGTKSTRSYIRRKLL
ncbi:MAG TPA: aldehyde dehydrogenase family protein [Candidatus Saccharimonadales bacterium]|jgi:acyl-CoA reductase-like NAD-dependent aldehyde dehydrogenase|nr:aldehyde dehydrogenase family protein [Candidatus Saccharimonadales bacterium]